MQYLYVKALHIIFIVTWFAGLFYIVRLYIYFKEAEVKPEVARSILLTQYQLMIKRLWLIITWPSAVLATIFAVWLLVLNPAFLKMGWMHIKLAFVLLLFVYHFICHRMYLQSQRGKIQMTATQLRLWNEVATIILFACVFLVILKNSMGWIFGVLGIVGLSVLLMIGVKLYKKLRRKKDWEK
ncbi:MAG: CopD family protein [Flavobacteriaceae bacterium]|nr:CopD family protein [Flavobacteriaceae bacterium]